MGNGIQFIDIILLAMVAGFIALRLRSVLGRRTGDETPPAEGGASRRDSVLAQQGFDAPRSGEDAPPSETVVRLEADPKLRRAFREIGRADPGFDVDVFMDGARAVYPMILEAFWKGDRHTLRQFLSDDVYTQFADAIDAREAAGHTVEARIIDLSDVRISEARLTEGMIEITVTYRAEIASVTRDPEGRVVTGNESDAISVVDIWTFERAADSPDPNWTLIATRSG